MRQRKIKDLDNKLAAYRDVTIEEPASLKGHWGDLFENEGPLYLEIGCGKGQFITENAKKHPERNFIAIEGHQSVVLRALEKTKEQNITNIRFVLEYVKDIRDFFADEELSGIYLNFSDPWPKERHAKRRLTYGKRLQQYLQILKNDGSVEFKTDNDGLFAFTLEQIEEEGLAAADVTRDLHNSEFAEDNIVTEYEDRFARSGKNINYVKIMKK